MADYRVNLENFSGPLDLLLYLVRKDEVDIYDIPIAKVTEEYVKYIEMLKMLNVDLAGDFLVMAATLMEVKSAMLLPAAETEETGEDDLGDPRKELIRQLLEYKKFKDRANLLRSNAEEQTQRYPRSDSVISKLQQGQVEPEVDIEQLGIWDLLGAFDAIMKATGNLMDISHIDDDTPIDLYQIELLHRLQTEGPTSFERIFESKPRLAMIGLFLGLLELVREKLVWAEQDEKTSTIYLRALTEKPAEEAVKEAMLATEVEKEETPEKPPIPIAEIDTPAKKQENEIEPVQLQPDQQDLASD